MRVYYMTSYETATQYILPEHRMRLSRFDKLNDPFELHSVRVEGKRGRAELKDIIKDWHNQIGIICTGRHWKSPVMWAHYANSHSGVCLGFDVPDKVAHQVVYAPERPILKLNPKLPLNGITEDILKTMLMTKYAQWSYEEEWRLSYKLTDPDPVNGCYYIPFGEHLTLREIIIGARCKHSAIDFDKPLGSVDQSITIIKARPAFESFTMVQQLKVTPVIIKTRK
ncbi:DUF2971 domain-containing protein [Rugamonas aquatica]|uniref:DUF2971 domain-containing protein n=1 Tax=Rugamonas aquatica TaxID=2743357 RepID=A0A6A7MYQ8_9BURK|nr:DUF2971 domain-containing protein [Rugamonas aquatica]MQA37841.1 DUF2971 domain-containing protein [Rugamonas aquatica]